MNQFESAIIEISGKCNAMCKWCITGRCNRNKIDMTKTCLSFDKFKKIYNHLIQLKAIDKKKDLMLYSWGEPFLNPEAEEIFSFLSLNQQSYSLSTNGSVYKKAFDTGTYKYMSSITFSLPGFSQESYDRIHGFNFEYVCKNIICLLEDMRKNGFEGNTLIVFHVYQFNQHEVEEAKKFADYLGADFLPYYAYFNGLSLAKKFINGTFSEEDLRTVQEEICLHYVEQRKAETPLDFKCPLRKILTIDEEGNLVICCAADKQTNGYILGEILSYKSTGKIEEALDWSMENNCECIECHEKKIDAWLTSYERWEGKGL